MSLLRLKFLRPKLSLDTHNVGVEALCNKMEPWVGAFQIKYHQLNYQNKSIFHFMSTDTDQNTGNLNTGIHYNTGKKGYDGAFYLLNTGNGNTGIVLGDFGMDWMYTIV